MNRPYSATVTPGTDLVYPITKFWDSCTVGVTPGLNGQVEVWYRLTTATEYKLWNRGNVAVYTEGRLLSPVESLKIKAFVSDAKVEIVL